MRGGLAKFGGRAPGTPRIAKKPYGMVLANCITHTMRSLSTQVLIML